MAELCILIGLTCARRRLEVVVVPLLLRPLELWFNCKKYSDRLEAELQDLDTILLSSIKDPNRPSLHTIRTALKDGDDLLVGQVPSLWSGCSRIKLSRDAEQILQKINEIKKGKTYEELLDELRGTVVTVKSPDNVASTSSSGQPAVRDPSQNYQWKKVPDFVVGIDDHKKRLVELVVSSPNGHKIGICGQGGCGKTLLTRLLQNEKEIQTHFTHGIVSVEVGKIDAKVINAKIIELQAEIYKRMTGKNGSFKTVRDGKDCMHNLFTKEGYKWLLIIDDVWDLEVLDKLNVADKILVTTRDVHLLDQFGAEKVEIDKLSPDDSWKLFSRHAKLKDPPKEITRIGKEIIEHFHGLPLALEIIGQAMAGRSHEKDWTNAKRKMEEAATIGRDEDEKLYERLKLSYDALEQNYQECFIDVALSTGNVYSDVVVRWKALSLVTRETDAADVLNKFVDYRLIREYDPYDVICIAVHDHVKGLAMYIMRKYKPNQRITELDKRLTKFPPFARRAVKVIELAGNNLKELPQPTKAPNLQLLDLGDNPLTSHIPKGFFQSFPNLKFLGLYRIEAEVVKKHLYGLTELQVLYLSRVDLDSKGYFSCKQKKAQSARLTHLNYASLAGYCPSLLTSCSSIEELHVVVSYQCLLHLPNNISSSLRSLKVLTISVQLDAKEQNAGFWSRMLEQNAVHGDHCLFEKIEFESLEDFGLHIGKLSPERITTISKMNWDAFPNLQRLSLSNMNWSQVKFSSFKMLRELHMHDYELVDTSFPYYFNHPQLSIGYLKNVSWGANLLRELPGDIGNLPELQILNVAMCPLIKINCGKDTFPELEKIYVHRKENVIVDLPRLNSDRPIELMIIYLADAMKTVVPAHLFDKLYQEFQIVLDKLDEKIKAPG